MKIIKLFLIFILLLSFGSIVFGQDKIVHPIKPKDFDGLGLTNDYKLLAQGFNSKVDQPFVFVARDAETYQQLQNLVEDLPSASTIDFNQNSVVAGFAGTRPTGGWTVEIRKSAEKVGVFIQPPGKGMMVTQMITTPFKVSLVPVEEGRALSLNPGAAFLDKAQNFLLKKGNFEFTGGFAGGRKTFKADGTIKLMTFGDFATVWFNLKSMGKKEKRYLSDIVSGTLKKENLKLERVDAGTFADRPRPPFAVMGNLRGKVLALSFEPLPSNVSDGYQGRGSLEAIRIK
jgi:hypothetical protein